MMTRDLTSGAAEQGLQPPLTLAPMTSHLPEVAEHGCYLFYPVRSEAGSLPDELDWTLAHLLQRGTVVQEEDKRTSAWIPADVQTTLRGERLTQGVWQASPLDIGAHLHPHICRLLGTPGGEAGEVGACAFRLSDPAHRLLSGRLLSYPQELPADQRRPKSLEIDLRPSAARRIAAQLGGDPCCTLQFDIADLRLVLFRTGYAVLIAEVVFRRSDRKPLDPCWVAEGVHSIAGFSALRWRIDDNTVVADPVGFTFADIVRSITNGMAPEQHTRRVFTATYMRFDEPPEPKAARRLAVQLSRRYTDDYRLRDRLHGVEFVQDFENVLHAFTLEGCATIVDASPQGREGSAEFLKTYKTRAYDSHYPPIVLLAFHEFTTLLHLSNDSSFWPEPCQGVPDPLKRLEHLRDQFLKFRLCYRLSHVSYISMHNAANRALRKVLALDRMAEDLRRDTADIDAYLQEASAKRTEARFRWMGIIGGGGLAWLTTFTIVKESLEVLLHIDDQLLHQINDHIPGLVAVAAGLIVGGMTGWLIWAKGRVAHRDRGKHGEHLGQHAAYEHVIHKALK